MKRAEEEEENRQGVNEEGREKEERNRQNVKTRN